MNWVDRLFMNHIVGKKKDIRVGARQEEESESQRTIKTRVNAVKIKGPIFIDGVIKGDRDKGQNNQLIAAPLTIAPILRFKVGRMNGVPCSREKLGVGELERYNKQKEVSRAE